MAELKKFMFDLDFDEPVPETVEGPPEFEEIELPLPPPPTFSEADLATAKDEAYARGKLDGLQEARSGTDSQVADLLGQIAAQVAQLDQAQMALGQRTKEDAVNVAVAVTKKLMPNFVLDHGIGEVRAVLVACMVRMTEEPRTIVRVHPEISAPVADQIQQMAHHAGIDDRIVVIADQAVEYGDCRVEWNQGGVERDVVRMWKEIDQVIEQNMATQTDANNPINDGAQSVEPTGNEPNSALDILAEDPSAVERGEGGKQTVPQTEITTAEPDATHGTPAEQETEIERPQPAPAELTDANPGDTDG